MAGVVLVGSNAFILSPILSVVAISLDSTPLQIAWAISSFGAATALSALFLAPVSDVYGARWTLAGASLLLGLGQLICLASTHWVQLCLGQGVAGLAVGILLPGIYATAMATAAPGQEASRLGFVLTGWALSLVAAVPISAAITEYLGWRPVYGGLAFICFLVAASFVGSIPGDLPRSGKRTNPYRALRLPGVAFLLCIVLGYMSAFYGCYAFFGEGLRVSLDLSATEAGLFVLVYGAGFGLAGLYIARFSPKLGRAYLALVLVAIGIDYFAWNLAIQSVPAALGVTFLWGVLNQFAVNALIVLLNKQAANARAAVLGLNSAVTYGSVFIGPFILGPVFQSFGFSAVATFAGIAVFVSAIAFFVGGKFLFPEHAT
ncbi:MAG: MFS transporter [Rhodobacteraceae bacterium]|nr:MFS transporter [Paracoccaceae bacterium]